MFLLAAAISVCAISIIVFGSLTGEKQQVSGGANASAQAAQDEQKRQEERKREEERKRKARNEMSSLFKKVEENRKQAENVAKAPKVKAKPRKEKVQSLGSLPNSEKMSAGKTVAAQAKVAPSPARTIVSPSVSVSSRR